MNELSLVQAVNAALSRAMSEDGSVLVLGEDGGLVGHSHWVTVFRREPARTDFKFHNRIKTMLSRA
mgnify:CR=1 FL=1